MMRSMYSGVSGLRNHQTRMDVIGNNIANVNTPGYKKSRVVFKDTFYQTSRGASRPTAERGGTNPMAVGLGVATASIDQIHTPAPTTTTNKTTDMAVDGNGYFAVNIGNNRFYTRAGAFDFDTDGTFVSTSNGYQVQGWTTNRDVDPATGDWTVLTSTNPSGISLANFKTLDPSATTEMKFSGNLNSTTKLTPAASEHQTLTFGTLPTAGMFRLSLDGQTTGWITADANPVTTAANIQTALQALTNVGSGNVTVTRNGNTFDISFVNGLANTDVAQIQFAGGSQALNGGAPGIVSVDGVTPVSEVVGIDIGSATSGNYTLSYNGNTTGLIPWNANASVIQNELITADPTLSGNITVSAGTAPYEYIITFTNALANSDRPNITMNNGGLSFPGLADAVATVTVTGVNPVNEAQTINLGGATQGYYTLTYGVGVGTEPIAYNATDAQILSALTTRYPGFAGNISVSGGVVTFINTLANTDIAPMVVNSVAAYNGAGAATATVAATFDQLAIPTANDSIITSRDVYDSLGNKKTVYFRFIKYNVDTSAVDNPISNWAVDISLNPLFENAAGYNATDMVNMDLGNTTPASNLPATGNRILRVTGLNFDENGKVIGQQPDPDPLTLTLDRDSIGADDIRFEIDFNYISQYEGKSTAWAEKQNGYKKGNLTDYTIGTDGTITGVYDNDETRTLARVALFTFENPAGLRQAGGSLFTESSNSGLANQGAPGEGGKGSIIPGSLEMANVDLSEEFTDMIVTQRGFQANSRIITTSDEMLQELVNLKR